MAALVHDEPWVDWMKSWSPAAGWLGMPGRAQAASADLVRRRQRDLLEHAHARSRFYRRHHGRHPGALMPAWQDIEPVDKSTLMQNFDQWVTDAAITRAGVEDFLADRSRIGEDFLRRYAIWTSSGTSGEPGIFIQDSNALAVYSTLLETRMDRRFATDRWWPMFSEAVGIATDDPTYQAALELVMKGRAQPNGYTEPVLHRRRLEEKAKHPA